MRDELEGYDLADTNAVVAKNTYSKAERKQDIANLIEIAIDQAEDIWETNIEWLVQGKVNRISKDRLHAWKWMREHERHRELVHGLVQALAKHGEQMSPEHTPGTFTEEPNFLGSNPHINDSVFSALKTILQAITSFQVNNVMREAMVVHIE